MREPAEVYMKTYGIKLEIPWWKRFLLGFPILNLFMNRVKVRVDATVFTAKGEPSHGTFRVFYTYYTISPRRDLIKIHLPLLVAYTRHGFGTYMKVTILTKGVLSLIKAKKGEECHSLGFVVDKRAPVTAHIWEEIDASFALTIPEDGGSEDE